MDRDFDDVFDSLVSHHRVIYTRKYSWESELFETRVILNAFQYIALSQISESSFESKIRPIVTRLLRDLRHYVRADIVLCAAGKPLFRRNGSVSALRTRRKLMPPALDRHG